MLHQGKGTQKGALSLVELMNRSNPWIITRSLFQRCKSLQLWFVFDMICIFYDTLEKNRRFCYNTTMGWFNYYGLAIMAIIMIPNIVYAVKHKSDGAEHKHNQAIVIAEQIGRYGCMAFMIFNIPYTYFDFWFRYGLAVYLSVNGGLCLAYIIFWIICWNRNDKLKALSLSVIPSAIFLFSGVALANIPLIVFAVLFAVSHITISYKNAT